MAQQQKQKIIQKTIHLFGELDLNMSWNKKNIIKEAGRIAEACGYYGGYSKSNNVLLVQSDNCESVKITFDGDTVVKVVRSTDDEKNWETLDFTDGFFKVSAETLAEYNKTIEYGTQQKLPMAQGTMMNEIVKEYEITAIRWGYQYDLMGLETKNQFLLWRDCGSHSELLGIINKDVSKAT